MLPNLNTKGKIPIEKNIIVTDEQGIQYEATYLKRAKGLVKKGRARFIDDYTICLACPPNLLNNLGDKMENTENIKAKTELILLSIEQFGESSIVADHLREGYSVILNLEQTRDEIRMRIVDFIAGACYMVGAHIRELAKNVYVFTPLTVEGDLLEELTRSGVLFGK